MRTEKYVTLRFALTDGSTLEPTVYAHEADQTYEALFGDRVSPSPKSLP